MVRLFTDAGAVVIANVTDISADFKNACITFASPTLTGFNTRGVPAGAGNVTITNSNPPVKIGTVIQQVAGGIVMTVQ